MSDWVRANLDAEVRWARLRGHPVRDLSAAARSHAARVGTLCRALWPEAERVWTLGPVDSACLRDVPGLAAVTLVTGSPPATPPMGTWADSDSKAAALANDRSTAFDVATELGVALAGSGWVESVEQVRARAANVEDWVLKAPFGTAGRGFIHGSGAAFGDVLVRRIDNGVRAFGRLLFEPWLTRTLDVGHVGHTEQMDVRSHRILSDERGRFCGIAQDATVQPDKVVLAAVRQALQDIGYQGPFGIDGFEAAGGHTVPLCEINARHTFGHVAHALFERVVPTWDRCVLRFGDEPERRDDRSVPLLGSQDGQSMTAWLENATR